MSLADRFKSLCIQYFPLNSPVILAVSGGIDSVVLCELSYHAGLKFSIAHCNFQLRGEESERDEEFIYRLAKKYNVNAIVKKFQSQYPSEKSIIVDDAAMLSQKNRDELQKEGYRYIVGARLSNTKPTLLKFISENLSKQDSAIIRIPNPDAEYEIVCTYSDARYKKDKREMDKQIEKAKTLLARQEPGRRAKFVKKANAKYLFDETLKQKTELLLGVKGYCTNIPESVLSNEKIVEHYHSLWKVEQAFRISKSDLQTRPIFHHSHDAIRAHVLICFMALMIGKYIEIKTGHSLRRVRDLLWQVQEVHLRDPINNLERAVLTSIPTGLNQILDLLEIKNTH